MAKCSNAKYQSEYRVEGGYCSSVFGEKGKDFLKVMNQYFRGILKNKRVGCFQYPTRLKKKL